MLIGRVTLLTLSLLLFGKSTFSQTALSPNPTLIIAVDEDSYGPIGASRSLSCLRVYSNGKVTYARWWRSGITLVDSETGKKEPQEHGASFEYQLEKYAADELSDFMQSKPVLKLSDSFAPPHAAIDYFETTHMKFQSKIVSKEITAREFFVASLVERARYPSALLVLLQRVDEIRKDAENRGKADNVPKMCKIVP